GGPAAGRAARKPRTPSGGESGRGRASVATAAVSAPDRGAAGSSAAASAGPAVVGRCPRSGCGGQIFMGRKGYGCSHYKTGCGFVIWKISFGKTLTDAMVVSLIGKGQTGKLKFKDERGEAFDGKLVLEDPATGKLKLERLS
uniref:topoisomerase C-terminal repeat-containing protein n=1 Tax=Cohnella sp. REN36 TaxID=2887347 RepID=UPI00351D163F|nr:DNA topoisomerase III [Cohnella sp. REN36]